MNSTAVAKNTPVKNQSASKPKSKSRPAGRTIRKCESLLGTKVVSKEFPGGRSRDSFRLILEQGGTVIGTKRPNQFKAAREINILKTLAPKGAAVPRLLATDNHRLLIQEEIKGLRLSEAISHREKAQVGRLLDSALSGLSKIHKLGSEAGFDKAIQKHGTSLDWIVSFLDRPAIIGRYYKISAPRPKLAKLEALLSVRTPRFIKWDARPGNAMVNADQAVFWIDWEHCCARNRIDDMGWLLADEFVPDHPEIEAQLLERHLPEFADHLSVDQATEYFYAYGVFHSSARLGLILKYKERGEWWDYDYCLKRDKIGITLDNALRTCCRAARWAEQTPLTTRLGPWFESMAEHIKTL